MVNTLRSATARRNTLRILLDVLIACTRDNAVRWSLLSFVILRGFTAIAALIMIQNVPAETPLWMLTTNPSGQTYFQSLPPDSVLYKWLEPWRRYDTAWYIKNAIQGYRPNDPAVVFPPLYPLLIRISAAFVGSNYVLASVFISNVCCVAVFVLLFKIMLFEGYPTSAARLALLSLVLFPTSYYLVAGYSESLFLALTLGAFYSARHKRWGWAGILIFLATLTRLQGAMLLFPIGWIAYLQLREEGWQAQLRRVPVIIGGPAGALSYLVYLRLNNLQSLEEAYAHEWQLYTRLPWESIQAFSQRLITGTTAFWENNSAAALLFVIVLGVVVVFRLRLAYGIYIVTAIFMILLRYHVGSQFEGMPRYVIVMFPCFMVLGTLLDRWWLLLPYGVGGVYWHLFLLNRFVHWQWVA